VNETALVPCQLPGLDYDWRNADPVTSEEFFVRECSYHNAKLAHTHAFMAHWGPKNTGFTQSQHERKKYVDLLIIYDQLFLQGKGDSHEFF